MTALVFRLMPYFDGGVVTDRDQPGSEFVECCCPHGGGVGAQGGETYPVVIVLTIHLDPVVVTAPHPTKHNSLFTCQHKTVALSLPMFGTISAFSTNVQPRFASVVFDGVLGPLRLAQHT